MSGGSWDFVFNNIREIYMYPCTPARAALLDHLELVAEAVYACEWVDSGDWSSGDETKYIMLALAGTVITEEHLRLAVKNGYEEPSK